MSKEMSASTNLHRHELFPGYVNSKPMSLLKSSNISRSLEGCTGTNQRHYISSSVNIINQYVEQRDYASLLKFVLDTIMDILRQKLIKEAPVSETFARGAEDLVLLELCTIHKIISYPDFSQITQVLNTLDYVMQPKLEISHGMLSTQVDPELMNKYIPQTKIGKSYNFSDARGF